MHPKEKEIDAEVVPWAGALALGAGLLSAPSLKRHAAPGQSMLPALERAKTPASPRTIAAAIVTAIAAACGACSASAANAQDTAIAVSLASKAAAGQRAALVARFAFALPSSCSLSCANLHD